jgi:hypothetical protein
MLLPQTASSADFSAIWDGSNGNWGDTVHWSTNPTFPNNTGAVTYDATINSGAVTLDRNITIQRFFLNHGTLSGDFALNLNEGLNWAGGAIKLSTINLAAGSISTISAGNLTGTINNSSTVNQTGFFYLSDGNSSQPSGTINNLAGATWNLPAGDVINGINIPFPHFNPPWVGSFNNAGNLVVTQNGTPSAPSFSEFLTAVNNTGNITIQPFAEGNAGTFYIDHGTADGSFNVGAQTILQLGSYTFNTGATIAGGGFTDVYGLITIAGDTDLSIRFRWFGGSLVIQKGATLTLSGPILQSLVTTRFAGGIITSAQLLNFQRGSLTGFGTINGDVASSATISPGASAGKLTINGALSLMNSSKIVMEIGGLTQGTQYDYLAIGGMVTLDGTLELHMLNGFQSQLDPSQTFTLLTSKDVLSGVFDNVANGARLTTADGLASFQVNYGAGSPYGANNLVLSDPHAVPEPASLVLFGGGVLALAFARFRRR